MPLTPLPCDRWVAWAGHAAYAEPVPLQVVLAEDNFLVREGVQRLLAAQPDVDSGMTAATLSKTVLTSIPPQLVPMLKTLRLGGMQDTLSIRLDQAQQQRLGYLEFLELLLGDEIERRANRALASRLSKAHFEDSDKSFENFDWAFNPKLPPEQLRELATGGYLARKGH